MVDTAVQSACVRGRFFEEWAIGQRLVTGRRRIDESDVSAFVTLCGDDNALHVQQRPLVPGLLTVSMATGLVAQLGVFCETTVALLHHRCDFLRPLYAPCVVRVEVEVVDIEAWKDAAAGVVETRRDIIDENETVVARCVHRTLVRRRGEHQRRSNGHEETRR